MTAFVHRLVIVVPLARMPAFATWYQANVDPADDGTNWPALNPSGLTTDPITNYWCSTALTDALLKLILVKACQIGSQTLPTNPQWNGWTQAQKIAWLIGVRDALYTACGIWLDLCDQTAAWNDPEAALTRVAVKRRQAAIG